MFDRLSDYYRQKWIDMKPQELQADSREYLHTFGAAVGLPALQAAITGVFFGLAAGVLAWAAGSRAAWAWGVGTWTALQALVWLGLLWRWLDLTQPLERITGLDLDRDGSVGEVEYPKVRIELTQDRNTTIAELNVSQEKLTRLAAGLMAGASFSEGQWTGSGAPFSRAEFRELRAEMLRRGLLMPASDKDIHQGYELTQGGRVAMRYFASLAAGSSPILGKGDQ